MRKCVLRTKRYMHAGCIKGVSRVVVGYIRGFSGEYWIVPKAAEVYTRAPMYGYSPGCIAYSATVSRIWLSVLCPMGHISMPVSELTPIGVKRDARRWHPRVSKETRCMALCVFILRFRGWYPRTIPGDVLRCFSWRWWWAQLCPIGHKLPE